MELLGWTANPHESRKRQNILSRRSPRIRSTDPSAEARIRFVLICIFLCAACAVWFEAGLSWDGAYLLFKVLDERAPFTPLFRYAHVVFQAPVVAAQRAGIEDLRILGPLFTAPYALIPLASLAMSWWIVRERRPRLFIWPALSITLANLPGAFFLTSEGPISTALFWPIVLAILVGRASRAQLLALAACGTFVAFLHPIAVPLFAGAGGLALVLGKRSAGAKRWALWSLGAVLIAAAFAKLQAGLTDYETRSLSIATFLETFRSATWGWPRLSLLCTLTATALIALQPRLLPRTKGRMQRMLLIWMPAVLALTAGAAMVPWARSASRWASALNYRFVMNTLSAGYLVLAALEGVRDQPAAAGESSGADPILRGRRAVAWLGALALLVVFVLQSLSWRDLCSRFQGDLEAATATCVPLASLPSVRGSALTHWSSASLAIVLQGREPRRLALGAEGCDELAKSGELWLAPWDHRPPGHGWFRIPR